MIAQSPSEGKAAAESLFSKSSSSMIEAGPGIDGSGILVGSMVEFCKVVIVDAGISIVAFGAQAAISITKTRLVIIIRFIELPHMDENKRFTHKILVVFNCLAHS
jgi:hypothetical protein